MYEQQRKAERAEEEEAEEELQEEDDEEEEEEEGEEGAETSVPCDGSSVTIGNTLHPSTSPRFSHTQS